MTVYVDTLRGYPMEAIQPAARRVGQAWCHMLADNMDELHAMARTIGMRASWFQPHDRRTWMHHYDLTPRRRTMALEAGAQEINIKDWIRQHRQGGGTE